MTTSDTRQVGDLLPGHRVILRDGRTARVVRSRRMPGRVREVTYETDAGQRVIETTPVWFAVRMAEGVTDAAD